MCKGTDTRAAGKKTGVAGGGSRGSTATGLGVLTALQLMGP